MSNTWTQAAITEWAVKTFGTPSNALELVGRAYDEFKELYEQTHAATGEGYLPYAQQFISIDNVLEEIADVVIVLSQVVQHLGGDLQEEIAKKMIKNVNRQWVSTGDGVGQHV